MELSKFSSFNSKIFESVTPHLPLLPSPSPHRRTYSISKNIESRYILSNSINEHMPKFFTSNHRRLRNFSSNHESSVSNELNIALKHLIPVKKVKKNLILQKKSTIISSLSARNAEENDIHGFVQSIFSHEPSPYRKMGLTSEPEAIDLRAADKILQDAKKIIKHGVIKKNSQHQHATQIEEFWKNQISHEKVVRWDIFEEGILVFLESFMVCSYGALRKLNWKSFFTKLYNKLSVDLDNYTLWPCSPTYQNPPKFALRLIKYITFANFVTNGELDRIMLACLEELPSYIENLRRGTTYHYSCGCFYKGEWKDGKREGNGILELCSGDKYSGTFNRGLREDYGTFKGDGYLYKGDFKRDKFHGYGKIIFPDEGQYEGLWVKNFFVNGKFVDGGGSGYVGEWQGYCYEGKGVLAMSDGTIKKGMWRGGRLCGEGKIKYRDGNVIKGFFVDDILQADNDEEN